MNPSTTDTNSKPLADGAQPLVNYSNDDEKIKVHLSETTTGPAVGNSTSTPEAAQDNDPNKAAAQVEPVVLYNKQDHCRWCYEFGDYEEGHEQSKLAKDLANSYYWSGNYLKDYMFFNRNWHPLIGIFVSHPAHPWTKLDRVAALIFSGCGSVFILSWSKSDDIPWYEIFLQATLPMNVVDFLMYYLLTSPIYFKHYPTCMTVLETIGRWSLYVLLFLSACLFFATSFRTGFKWRRLADETAKSFAMSWAFWIPLHYFLPCFGFRWVWSREEAVAQEKDKLKDASEVQLQELESQGLSETPLWLKGQAMKAQRNEQADAEKGHLTGSPDSRKDQLAKKAGPEEVQPTENMHRW